MAKKYDDAFKKKAEKVLAASKSRAEAAEKLGCSKNTLRRLFGEAPKKPKAEKKAKKPKKDKKAKKSKKVKKAKKSKKKKSE